MQLTRTAGPRLNARACVNATIPPLKAAYASLFGSDCSARVEAMLTIAPRAARNCAAQCLVCVFMTIV
jgi:hypothetical protein